MSTTVPKKQTGRRALGYDSLSFSEPYKLFDSQLSTLRTLVASLPHHPHAPTAQAILDLLNAQQPIRYQFNSNSDELLAHPSEAHKVSTMIGAVNTAAGDALLDPKGNPAALDTGLHEILDFSSQLYALVERHPHFAGQFRDLGLNLSEVIKVATVIDRQRALICACEGAHSQWTALTEYYLDNFDDEGAFEKTAEKAHSLLWAYDMVSETLSAHASAIPGPQQLHLTTEIQKITAIGQDGLRQALRCSISTDDEHWPGIRRAKFDALKALAQAAQLLLNWAKLASDSLLPVQVWHVNLDTLENAIHAVGVVLADEEQEEEGYSSGAESEAECGVAKRSTRFVRVLNSRSV